MTQPRTTHPKLVPAAAAAALAAVGLTAAPASATWTDHLHHCGKTAKEYGYSAPCLEGSVFDRAFGGGYDETFAIRSDHEVIHASPGHPWAPVSNGRADDVKFTANLGGGRRNVCVTITMGHSAKAYQAVYTSSTGKWSTFHVGCEGVG